MKRTKLRFGIAVALTACWLCVIWGNSLLPGESSSQFSGWVGQLLERLLPFLHMDSELAITVLRKLAHFSEFAVLGVLLSWLCGMLGNRWFVPALWGIAAASVDETIQRFVPGRYGCLTDVLIDTAGVLAGVLLVSLYTRFKKK